jgi:hypothetical protein
VSIESSWLAFSHHGGGCVPCGLAQDRIRALMTGDPDWGRRDVIEELGRCCPEGTLLAEEWDGECRAHTAEAGERARALGVWESFPGREERVDALMNLPAEALQRLEALDPQLREAEIHALVYAHTRSRRFETPGAAVARPSGKLSGKCVDCGARCNPSHDRCVKCWKIANR